MMRFMEMESHGGGSQIDEMLREEAETYIWMKVKRGDIVTVRDIQKHLDRVIAIDDDGDRWDGECEGMSSQRELLTWFTSWGSVCSLNSRIY